MNRQNVVWNMIGSAVYALATVVLMTVVKRTAGLDAGNDFSFAYTLAQTLLTVGYFETRLFQVTDVKNVYSFSEYFTFRSLTCTAMMAGCFGYILISQETKERIPLIVLLCLYKMLDGIADVFEGDYQKNGRLDLSGKSLTLRTICSVVIFSVVIAVTRNCVLASCGAVMTSLLIIAFLNPRFRRSFATDDKHIQREKLKKLFLDCFFLALGAFLCTYILNAVKYAVDWYADDYNYVFGALFMPTAFINLIGGMLFKPVLTTLAQDYERREYKKFLQLLGILIGAVAGLTVVCMAGAYLLGIPVLSALYAVDLSAYRSDLLILIVGGGLNAAGILVYYGLVVMRMQKKIFNCYFITFLVTLVLPFRLVNKWKIRGASWAFVMIMLVQFLVFAALLLWECRKGAASGQTVLKEKEYMENCNEEC